MSWMREHSVDWFLVCVGIGFLMGVTAKRYTPWVAAQTFILVMLLGSILHAMGIDI